MARIKIAGLTGTSKPKKKQRITSISVRESAKRSLAPSWEGADEWSADQFRKTYYEALQYYSIESASKNLRPAVIKWMKAVGYEDEEVMQFDNTLEWRCSPTMGSIANCLLDGMPEQRDDFNNGKNTADWLHASIAKAIKDGAEDCSLSSKSFKISPKDRMQEIASKMMTEIEDALELFATDPEMFDPAAVDLIKILRQYDCKLGHARIIKDHYKKTYHELLELTSGRGDEQLREGYRHLPRKYVKKLLEFHKAISLACSVIIEDAKLDKIQQPAKVTAVTEKTLAKLKYKKADEILKITSINPAAIVGSKELWVYHTRTRKLGKYVAAEGCTLGVKGTSITGYDEKASIQKTLRRPAEQLITFKSLNKATLTEFLKNIVAVETNLNSRVNDDILLLYAQ